MGTGSYAAVAADQPFGLVALRFRGVRYWWAGLGLFVLVALYAAPIGESFRQPSLPAKTTPLPGLSIPAVSFPLFHAPALRRQAPLPALPHRAAPVTHATAPTPATTARPRVPVVSDVHAEAPRAAATKQAAPKDPFANAPVVSDNIGTPVALPATATQATAAPTTPAPPTATPAAPAGGSTDPTNTTDPAQAQTPATNDMSSGGYKWFSANEATDNTSSVAAPDASQEAVTATVGSSDTGTLGSGAVDPTQDVAGTGSADTVSAVGTDSDGTTVTTTSGLTASAGWRQHDPEQ